MREEETMEQLELERVERGAPFVNDGLSMFSGVEWGHPTVIALLIFLTIGILTSVGLIFFWLRTFKLYIPRSELYNEEYIESSIKNITAFRRYILYPLAIISTAITLIGTLIMILYGEILMTKHYQLLEKILPFAFLPIFISIACGSVTFLKKGHSTKELLTGEDILKMINLQRSLHPPNQQKKLHKSMKVRR